MARRKKLIRFTILADGAQRQLFKVRDRGTELTLIHVSGEAFKGGFHHGATVLERRFSVHASTQSARNLNAIKQTVRLSDGRLIENVLYAGGPKADLPNALFADLCCDLRNLRYQVQAASKDEVFSIGEFTPSKQSLVYGVLLTSTTGPTAIDLGPNFREVYRDFGEFRLIVVWSLIPIPSSPDGAFVSFSSTHSRFDKEDVGPLALPFEVEPVLPLELTRAMLGGTFETLRQRVIGSVSNLLPHQVLRAFQKIGFGFWSGDNLLKELRRIIG